MDRLNQVAAYFNEKERKKLDNKAKESRDGLPEMTADEVKLSCLENNGFETPELNDKIYLHFRGFKKIENLEAYTGCKSIWLESNGFTEIENLSALQELRCLYLSKNLIGNIKGLNDLVNLTILDVSYNRLASIDNLSCCVNLQTLNASHNALSSADSIRHLQECSSLQNIDLTSNRLQKDEDVLSVFQNMPALVAMSVNGNDVTKLPTFRKKTIASMPKLGYLDRPIDEQERCFATAFIEGGSEAETAARNKWKEDQTNKRIREQEEYRIWQSEQAKIRQNAKEQGRSLITEFTPEEVAQRAAEAKKAADDEKAMLSLGVGKVASRYWQLEGKGGDALAEATKQLLEEEQFKAKAQSEAEAEAAAAEQEARVVELDDVDIDIDESKRIVELPDNSPAASPAKAEGANKLASALSEVTLVEPTVDEASSSSEEKKSEELESSMEPQADFEDDVALKAAAAMLEQSEQNLRNSRVAESFAIYKAQLQQNWVKTKSGKNPCSSSTMTSSSSPVAASVPTSTWDAPASVIDDKPKPLYWSENMDIELGKLVKVCAFDFDEITMKMKDMAVAGLLGNTAVHESPDLVTNEACRKRWSQLDSSQWCTASPDVTALDTVFKICINPSVLGKGHGSQPSFQALSSMSASSIPKYLTPPTTFPSVGDLPEDDEEEEQLDLD